MQYENFNCTALLPVIPLEATNHYSANTMSATATASTSSSSIQTLFKNVLKEYTNQTGDDLASHPLSTRIKNCDSIESITAVL